MDAPGSSMRSWDYLDFELEIRGGGPRDYPVSVRCPAGEAQAEMRFPFDEWELKDRLQALEIALLRSGGTRRRIPSPEEHTVRDFGRGLFESLLVGDVRTRYEMSLREARRQGKGLRLKLRIQPSELAVLPWEFLYDAGRDRYPSLSSTTPLVRYLDLPQPVEPLHVRPPLRVLGMVTSPSGLDPLDVEHEKRLVGEAIRRLRENGLLELTWLEGQTWRHLMRAMRHGPWHVFHFVGHGGFDAATEEGALALSDEAGHMHLLRATGLAELLDDHYPLRMVFLNSCEGARGSESDAFSSTAATLVRRGVPAVVAMQYEITDSAAIEFSRDFYEALADGLPVDAAVTEARAAVSMDSTLEWGTPVLYMHSPDGRIFDISTQATEDRRAQDPLRRYREAVESAWADGKLESGEVHLLRDLANNRLTAAAASGIEREVMGDTIEAIVRRQETAEEEEKQNRLDQLYDQGERCVAAEEWQQALAYLEEVERIDPGYRESGRLLSEARRQLGSGPQDALPALGNWWSLALRGLVVVIFGLVVAFLSGTFRLVGPLMVMADGVLAFVDAAGSRSRRSPLLIQGIIGCLAGLLTLIIVLMDISRAPAYLVGSWAILMSIIRIIAAIQLRWEFRMVRLLVISSVSLLVLGILVAWPTPHPWWPPWELIGILALVSGITLITFAFRVAR